MNGHDFPSPSNLPERLAQLDSQPTETLAEDDLRRVRMVLNSMPYLGGLLPPITDRTTVKDVCGILAALAVHVDRAADRNNVIEHQFHSLQRDVDGFRRLVGLTGQEG